MTDLQIKILMSLRDKGVPEDAALLDDVIHNRLDMNNIQRVCEIINDEYLLKGIEEDYSPNEYGRKLEEILNKVNALRLL